jgi:hypothetical protein
MPIDTILERVRDGQGSGADFQALEAWLAGDRMGGDLYDVISNYLWHAPQPRFELVEPFLALRSDPMVVAATVSGLATRGYDASGFVDAVVAFAAGEPWDKGNDLRTAAILALPKVAARDDRTRAVLIDSAKYGTPSVQDCAWIAAQQILGMPAKDVIWGKTEGDLVNRVSPEVRAWLGQ